MSEDATSGGAWKAPYMSYETLTNFFEKKIGSHPLPPRIDTHFLDNYAGSVRPLLISTLKTIGMLGENNEVLEPLRIAAQGPDDLKKVLRQWAEVFYVEQCALAAQHGTAQMLWETFAKHKYNGSTLRKAVVFYLAVSEDVGLRVSAHFRPPKAVVISKSKLASVRAGAAEVDHGQDVDRGSLSGSGSETGRTTGGEERVVSLGAAGTVTINVDVRWLDLPEETFVKLRQLVRELTDLGVGEPEVDAGAEGGAS